MQHHLSWRVRSSGSTTRPSQSCMRGEFTLSLYAQPSLPVFVGRIDVDALHLAVVGRQQGLHGREVVAVDEQVVVQARPVAQPLLAQRQQLVEGHGQMVVLDEDLPLEVQPWQSALLQRLQRIPPDLGGIVHTLFDDLGQIV